MRGQERERGRSASKRDREGASKAHQTIPCTHSWPPVCASHRQELRTETLGKSTLARSMGRGTQSARDYMQAHSSHAQIAVVRKAEGAYRIKEEHARQADERQNLTKAYKIERVRFEEEWASRIAAVEAECAEKERVLLEIHEIARADCETRIEKDVGRMRYKATSTLLQLEDTEKKLVRLNEFKEAAEVSSRAHRQRTVEQALFERSKAHVGSRPREVLTETQEAEMRNLMQRCHSLRVAVRREKDQAFEVFKQKYRNLEADLAHSHSIEFSLRPEMGPVQTHKSRSTQSSTFRGTLKYESLAGTKFDVPDVSSLPPIPASEMRPTTSD